MGAITRKWETKWIKVFCFFFSKKKAFLSFLVQQAALQGMPPQGILDCAVCADHVEPDATKQLLEVIRSYLR